MNKLDIYRELTNRNAPLMCDTTNAEFFRSELLYLHPIEQELHLNDCRDEETIAVCCSNGLWLTKLKKNPNFIVTRILYAPDFRILELTGHLPKHFITIKTKRRGGQ